MRSTIASYSCNDIQAIYRMDEHQHVELLLVPVDAEDVIRDDYEPEPLVQAKLVGDDYPFGFSQGRTMRNAATVQSMRYDSQRVQQHGDVTQVETTLTDDRGYSYVHHLLLSQQSQAVEMWTTFENHSNRSATLEMLSSFSLGGLSPYQQGLAPGSLIMHRLRSTWSDEGRLISEPIEQCQLEPSWQQYSANSIRYGSVGSFPVREFVPFIGIEDTKSGVTWVAQTTHASSWQIEVYRRDYGLSVSGGIADREFGQWTRVVQPDGRFETPKAVVAVGFGGVDAIAQRVVNNIRRHLDLPASEHSMPVIFNEFCTSWGTPTEQEVLHQVEFAKDKGIDYLVIDAGWYDDKAFEQASRLGSWEVSDKAFPHGFKPVVQAIHDAGLKAGIWFEFEIVGRDDTVCFNKLDWLLKRDDLPITSGNRRWWDMRNPQVQQYLSERVIDFLRDNGFDYLKVDYNDSIGIGCQTPGEPERSLGDGLYEQILASQTFFDKIHEELPDLVIELCASGGHRLVQSFLQRTSMASFSDCHECDEIPVIAANMHRMILPRQSQIWAVVKAGQPISKLYYQICSGLLGRLCFSGDTDTLSQQQVALMERGARWYHQVSDIIDHGTSIWHDSMGVSYRYPTGWQGIERVSDDGRILLVLHTFHDAPNRVSVSLSSSPVPLSLSKDSVFAREGIDVSIQGDTLTINGLRDFDGVAIELN